MMSQSSDELSFIKDTIGVFIVAYTIWSHYPRNGPLIIAYITIGFVVFWQVVKSRIKVVTNLSEEYELFVILFFLAKVLLDCMAIPFRLV